MRSVVRALSHADRAALETFLKPLADSSMFLRSNVRAAELTYEGKPLHVPNRPSCGRVPARRLLDARAQGVSRAVLFAEREDAKRAYLGSGFRPVGRYGLLLF